MIPTKRGNTITLANAELMKSDGYFFARVAKSR
jgi:hypothetical protein